MENGDGIDERADAAPAAEADAQAPPEEASGVEAEAPAGGDDHRLVSIVESLLFASGEPVPLRRLVEILGGPSAGEVRRAVQALVASCAGHDRGVRVVEVAGGYQLRTARENAEWVNALFRERPRRLGRAALETLAIIAYRQPITRAEIEAIRGVDIEAVLATLLRRELVAVCGRKETVGRPLLYETTTTFLELFGLRDLAELPTLKDLPAVGMEHADERGATTDGTGSPLAEAPQSGGGDLAAEGGGADSDREDPRQRPGGDGAGDEGGPAD